ncbi:MAG: quinohemoprotein ethanol dehydrogenase [Verrucomicrobiota bacterium]
MVAPRAIGNHWRTEHLHGRRRTIYVAVLSGWGGVYPLSTGSAAADSGNLRNVSRILAFKLGGTATLPPIQKTTFVLSPPPEPKDAVSIGHGELLFARYCSGCHGERGLGGGVTPDLRASGLLGTDFFYNVVLDGALKDAGMASFKSVLDRDDVTAIRNDLIHRANEDNKGVAPSAAER